MLKTLATRRLSVMMIRKPTERVPSFSELFVDAIIEGCFGGIATGAVAVLNPWALLGVAKALMLASRVFAIWDTKRANFIGCLLRDLGILGIHRLEPSLTTYLV